MRELQRQAARWEAAALVLGTLAFVLVLPRPPHHDKTEKQNPSLVGSQAGNMWLTYFGKCILCGAVVLALAFMLAAMMLFGGDLLWRIFWHA